jgi:DNA-binding CsgD family transcriptional regulator
MDTWAKFARRKLKKDILAKVLLSLSEKQKAMKQRAHSRIYEGILRLSPRQIQIVKYLFEGYSYGEISTVLSIARNTVHSHARRIYGILGVKGKYELYAQLTSEEYDLICERFEEAEAGV